MEDEAYDRVGREEVGMGGGKLIIGSPRFII